MSGLIPLALIFTILYLQIIILRADSVGRVTVTKNVDDKSAASPSQIFSTSSATYVNDDDDEESPEEILNWLRQQQLEVSIAQANLVQKLRDFGIPAGLSPGTFKSQKEDNPDDLSQRIITSTTDNNIECRVTLGRAQLGRKCVAPCQCTGSQKWVQFSLLNKLRRKDPQAWITCPTCRTPYRYDIILAKSDLQTSLLSAALDNMIVLRSILATTFVISTLKGGLPSITMRLLVSRAFWQKFPQWSKITHLPLAMKIWIGKLVVTELWHRYLRLEKDYIVEALANIETQWIENSLPSPNHPVEIDDITDYDNEDTEVEETEEEIVPIDDNEE